MKYAVKIIISLFSLSVLAADNVETIDESSGYKRLQISNGTYETLFDEVIDDSSSTTGSVFAKPQAPTIETNEVVVIQSLRGLQTANFPDWLELEILEDEGFSSWSEVSDTQLDNTIETRTFDIDAVNVVAKTMNDNGLSTLAQKFSFSDLNPCKKKWENKSKLLSKSFNQNRSNVYNENDGAFSASLDTVFESDGKIDARVYYKIKKRCGIPYGAEFRYANIDVDGTVGGNMGVAGNINYELKEKLFKKNIKLWSTKYDWFVYIFQFEVNLEVGIDLGVNLEAEASANFETVYNVGGDVGISWQCTSSGCTKTRNDVDMDFTPSLQTSYEAQVKVSVIPYADTYFSAELDMYWGAFELAQARVGIVAALPVTYYGYIGNMCSDANHDGVNEQVKGSLIDIYGELSAYMQVKLANRQWKFDLKLKIHDWNAALQVARTADINEDPRNVITVARKHMYFKDLIGSGSSILQPTMYLPNLTRLSDGVQVGSRSCYPFSDGLKVEVDWGDGSTNYIGSAGEIQHTWGAPGNYQVRIRSLGDNFGRAFTSDWISKVTTVQDKDGIIGLKQIQNFWRLNDFIHIENGFVRSEPIDMGWWSSMWYLEKVGYYYKIRNRWKPEEYLHVENGYLESGPIEQGWVSALWHLSEQHSGWDNVYPDLGLSGNVFTIQNVWKGDMYLHTENGSVEAGPIDSGWWSARWILNSLE